MTCSICKYDIRRKYCEGCGNDSQNQAKPTSVGIGNLVQAYDAMRDPWEDYQTAINEFQKALKHRNSFPEVLLLASLFEYGMAIVKSGGGGPLKYLTTPQLEGLINVLEDARQVNEGLSKETQMALILSDYEQMIRSNMSEAKRALQTRCV